MHNETLEKLTNAAKNKINMLNNSKLKYLVSSAFAGLYVGLGIILIFTVGGLLSAVDSPMTKIDGTIFCSSTMFSCYDRE